MINFFYGIINKYKNYIQYGTTNIKELTYKNLYEMKKMDINEIIDLKIYLLNINSVNIEKYREIIIKCIEKLIDEKGVENILKIDYLLFDIEDGIASIPLFQIIINSGKNNHCNNNNKSLFKYYRFEINNILLN
jgi:hypothetical protein